MKLFPRGISAENMPTLIDLYKTHVGDLWQVGSRCENTRKYYLTVVSSILAFLALAGKDGPLKGVADPIQLIVGLVGILVCLLWFIHMRANSALFHAKFKVLDEVETELSCRMFAMELSYIKQGKSHLFLCIADCGVPVIFAVVFVSMLCLINF